MKKPKDNQIRILIVDDERLIRNILSEILSEKYSCTTANSGEEALKLLQKKEFNLVLSDIEMSGMSGIELISHVHKVSPETVVVMISGSQDIESAIGSLRVGAFDYIKKPFDLDHIEIAIDRAINHHLLLVAKHQYETQLEELVKKRTEELNYLSYHDVLTDLPNRSLFEDRLSQALSQANFTHQKLAILLLSLNRFKDIYDALGQTLGNQLLQDVAKQLKNYLLKGVTIAKFEGDEFAILLTQINNTEEIVEFTNNLKETLNLPFVIEKNEIFITFNLGISLFPTDGNDAQTLLKNAGVALSRSKEEGRNNYQFYTTDMNILAVKRLEMEISLRRALERNEFEVYYQPKLCTKTRKIVGMEALVRWHHPTLGFISPAEFIPLAEETGLILPLGEWVLRTACNQIKLWNEEGHPLLKVSVNLSAYQFQQQNLLETITKIIEETRIEPNYLELEMTESSIMKNETCAVTILHQLKEAGIKISIDDFGTGYSSLSHLKKLPLDVLKIDKSFVQDMTVSPDDASLVMTIITLAHNLGLKVIAEGVETEEQLRFLHLLRCDEWQGFLYSKPVPADVFEELLDDNRQNKLPVLQLDFFRNLIHEEAAEF
ncbi:MAG TPA: EAL domain-containing protein [Pyrinomonadaceae bacterium]|nr:EAL domain-containing protein [Pyrinomonadaceae bacterium]